MAIESKAQLHDESFELLYDIDKDGNLVNVGIEESGEWCDDDGDMYDDFDSYDDDDDADFDAEDDQPGTSMSY